MGFLSPSLDEFHFSSCSRIPLSQGSSRKYMYVCARNARRPHIMNTFISTTVANATCYKLTIESTEIIRTHELSYAAYSAHPICLSHTQGMWFSRECTGLPSMDCLTTSMDCRQGRTRDANALRKSHDHLSTYRVECLQ